MRRLEEWEEVIGIPTSADENVIHFENIGGIIIDNDDAIKTIKEHIGRLVGVLRTDIQDMPYAVRVIKGKNKGVKDGLQENK